MISLLLAVGNKLIAMYTDPFQLILNRISKLQDIVIELGSRRSEKSGKRICDFDEACEYLHFKRSYMRKLMRTNQIPYSRPNGGKVYFSIIELEEWALRNRQECVEKIASDAALSSKQ